MGVHFLLSKSLAPTYWRLVKVNLTIAASTKNCNTAATKNKEKEGRKCQTRWAPSGPSFKSTKLGELHMGPSVYRVTTCLFFCLFILVELGELHRARVKVMSNLVSSIRAQVLSCHNLLNLFVCLFLMLDQGWSLTNQFITISVLEHPWEIQPLSICM